MREGKGNKERQEKEKKREQEERKEKEMGEHQLFHRLHPKHLTKVIVLHAVQGLHQNIGSHILSANEFQGNGPILYTLPNIVVLHLDVLCCGVVDGVSSKQVHSMIIDIQDGGVRDVLVQFQEEMAEPNKLLRSFCCGNVFCMRGRCSHGALLLRHPRNSTPCEREDMA